MVLISLILDPSWHAAFEKMKELRSTGALTISEALWSCLLSFFEYLRWPNFLKDMEQQPLPLTLLHGDFHPGNIMWIPSAEDSVGRVKFLDWEMVTLGHGPQELGQYVISHMDIIKYGADVHRRLVHAYYEELVKVNPEIGLSCSVDMCYESFVYDGMRKWLWMLPQISCFCLDYMPFSVNQVDSFREMHNVKSEKVGYST